MAKIFFYAVKQGRSPGIYRSWAECESQVKGFPGAVYKKFPTVSEAETFVGREGLLCGGNLGGQKLGGQILGGEKSQVTKISDNKPGKESSHLEEKKSRLLQELQDHHHVIYTDGASKGNGKAGARAGWGVFFGDDDKRNVGFPLEGEKQTNQRAELTAVKYALECIAKEVEENTLEKCYKIGTDSQYTMNCLTKWCQNWIRNNWMIKSIKMERGQKVVSTKPVMNADLIKPSISLIENINKAYKVKGWKPLQIFYVQAHVGIHGNEMADKLANQGACLNQKV